MQRGTILNHQTLLIWNSHKSFYSILNREVNLKGKESVLTILRSHHQTWTEFPPPPSLPKKKCKGKTLSLFPFWLFIPEPLLLPLSSSFFPPSALENAPINLGNQPHKHSSQSRGELLSSHLLLCFTTKNPYGFVVSCKEPEPRPKMDPKYCPRLIWSLWARAM